MTIFVKLGGCNGSGKTSVVRHIVETVAPTTYTNQRTGKVDWSVGFYEGVAITVLGSYKNACGGMDAINNKEELRALWHRAMRREGIVIGEGLIFGKTYGYIGEQVLKLRGIKTLWAFMGTPFEECAERVENRRAVAAMMKGKEPTPFDPERTMRLTYTIMERLEAGVRSGKYPIDGEVMQLEYKPGRQPSTHAKQLLKKALEMHNANR